MAGNLVKKKIVPRARDFPDRRTLFVALLIGTIIIVAALTFFPAVSLGPILEHFKLIAGTDMAMHPHAPSAGAPASRIPSSWFPHRSELRQAGPRAMVRNPVMFIVEIGAVMTTTGSSPASSATPATPASSAQIALWLWFTVLFANFAEAIAEGRGKPRRRRCAGRAPRRSHASCRAGSEAPSRVPAPDLRKGDIVVCEAGDVIRATARSSKASRALMIGDYR